MFEWVWMINSLFMLAWMGILIYYFELLGIRMRSRMNVNNGQRLYFCRVVIQFYLMNRLAQYMSRKMLQR